MKIGDVAERTGTTTRTIRYYEEIGLLPCSEERVAGAHRAYSDDDVERLSHVLRLKELLGVSLEDLRTLVEAEDARAVLRAEFHAGPDAKRRNEILAEAIVLIERQLELLRGRRAELDRLETELTERRDRAKGLLTSPS